MTNDEFSLSNLSDIVIPEPPPYWPPALGGWIVLIILTLVVVLLGNFLYSHWVQNSYRRAGLRLLGGVTTSHELSVLLKRVALASYSCEMVASLYGAEWISFLNKTCPRSQFSQSFVSEPAQMVDVELLNAANIWIRKHKAQTEISPCP